MTNKYGMEYCDCYKGFKLSDEPGKCEDIDECSILGSCSQNCINSIGHFKVYFLFKMIHIMYDTFNKFIYFFIVRLH